MGARNDVMRSARYSTAYFDTEEGLVVAADESRRRGIAIEDVHSPYAIHGMEEAAGFRMSRLTRISLIGGLTGLTLALVMQIWTSAVDWPVNIGGKPFNSLPAFIPVTFELTVLFSGIASLVALLIKGRLWFGSRRRALERITDDRFALVLRLSDASVDPVRLHDMLRQLGAVEIVQGDTLA